MRFINVTALAILLFQADLFSADRVTGADFATRSEVIAKNGMVATSHPLATQVGIDILKAGGNAVDAAIAANAVIGLMEPTGNGIGGDLFAIVWDAKTENLYGYNGSGRSPKSLTFKKLKEELSRLDVEKIPAKGVLPISVPGCVDGWFALHDRFGKMSMNELMEPAVSYAREGFPVTEVISYYWGFAIRAFKEQPGFMETFATEDGDEPKKGEIWRNEALANTLERIGDNGRDEFYSGKTAREMVEFVQSYGGFLSMQDLQEHRGEWVSPLFVEYKGYELWELPPNGQGIAALQMIQILKGYDFDQIEFGSADHIHYLVEAKKLAFEDRAKFYSDPDFNEIPVESLLSEEYASLLRARIDSTKAMVSVEDEPGPEGDTIYLTTADRWGNMVSLIQSNYRGHGSGVCPPKLGFCLQDRGELFNMDPHHFNAYEPGKRPFHTIIPAFVTKGGKPWLSFGVMGGATQPQAHVQILINLVDFGMNLQEAGDAPRIVHTGSSQPTGEIMRDGGKLHLESGFSAETIEELKRRGHNHSAFNRPGLFGGYQAILRDENGVYYGASESRKDGQASGY